MAKKIIRKLAVYQDRETNKIPVKEFLLSLKDRHETKYRLSFSKFPVYVRVLLSVGPLLAGTNYVRKIEGIKEDIWELRPGDARVFFVALMSETIETGVTVENYVLLHGFVKSSQKTPPNEIKQAQYEFERIIKGQAETAIVDDVDGIINLAIESELTDVGENEK